VEVAFRATRLQPSPKLWALPRFFPSLPSRFQERQCFDFLPFQVVIQRRSAVLSLEIAMVWVISRKPDSRWILGLLSRSFSQPEREQRKPQIKADRPSQEKS
jgi:hypothetical protein